MHKQHAHRIDAPPPAKRGGYEGKTIQLDPGERAEHGAAHTRRAGFWWGGFPWLALWLIWPASFVLKKLTALLAALTTSLGAPDAALTVPTAFVAVLLILVGIMLMRRT